MARKKDENQTAFSSLQELLRNDAERDGISIAPIPPEEKDAKAVAAGKLGGLKGGKARAKNLSARRLKDIAQKAAKARWNKEPVL
jgi:hypothetical protein